MKVHYEIEFRTHKTNGNWHRLWIPRPGLAECTTLQEVEEEIKIRTAGEKEQAVLDSLEIRVIKVTEEEVQRLSEPKPEDPNAEQDQAFSRFD
jgi:hypothetical protein